MKNLFVAIALAASVVLASASAQAEESCRMAWSAQQEVATGQGYRSVEIVGKDKEVLLKNYNSEDPKTDFAPERVFVWGKSGVPELVLTLVSNGCVMMTQPVTEAYLIKLLTPAAPGRFDNI